MKCFVFILLFALNAFAINEVKTNSVKVKGAPSQAADFLNMTDSTGTVLSRFSPDGILSIGPSQVQGTISINGPGSGSSEKSLFSLSADDGTPWAVTFFRNDITWGRSYLYNAGDAEFGDGFGGSLELYINTGASEFSEERVWSGTKENFHVFKPILMHSSDILSNSLASIGSTTQRFGNVWSEQNETFLITGFPGGSFGNPSNGALNFQDSTNDVFIYSKSITGGNTSGRATGVHIATQDETAAATASKPIIEETGQALNGASGSFTRKTGDSNNNHATGLISDKTGDTSGSANTGSYSVVTGEIAGAPSTGSSGSVLSSSGNNSGTGGNTGQNSQKTGNHFGTGNTGDIVHQSGNATTGNSGNIIQQTGTASGIRGTIEQDAKEIDYFGIGSTKKIFTSPSTPIALWGSDQPAILLNSENFATGAEAMNFGSSDSSVAGTFTTAVNLFTGQNTANSATADTGSLILSTGSQAGTGSTADTGFAGVFSGSIFNSTSSGVTGSVSGASGDNDGTGATGPADFRSGNQTGSAGNSGYAYLHSGNSDNGNSGITRQFSGTAVNGTSGEVDSLSGNGQASGNVINQSGNASAGNSGDVVNRTGTATGTRGKIVLDGLYIDASSTKISNVTNPTSAQDAATKLYVDNFVLPVLRYHNATGTLTGSDSLITFSTSDFDTASAYSSGVFTVPSGAGGTYWVSAQLFVLGTYAASNFTQIAIYKNGSLWSRNSIQVVGAATNQSVHIADTVTAVATDTIEIRASTDATTPTVNSSNELNFLNIRKNGI